ncbi:uncharacterized protein N7511_009026 [Penicillium nucicola]|uniref:uncharacterized protein n=1 Tax=Penicillium nucicola TaxID=1850975 RepID=UPI002545117E|nr:uncharacterized protein N7511_009026 [Penicillium nucicola]KAJ5747330.1 hypothetical protein N7511_009026 [Penicillium nucicola]
MRLAGVSLFVTVATATSSWWVFDAWDGLSCGDAPQNGQIFFTSEGHGEMTCISFDEAQRAYSYAASFGEDDVEIWGFLHEHCEGPRKAFLNNTCMNPDIVVPYIRSWKIYNTGEADSTAQ